MFDTKHIEDDIWTVSKKFKMDLYDFFKEKLSDVHTIAEIGAHKGYCTKTLSKIFDRVIAVDYDISMLNFNKQYNKDSDNIEYVLLDLYRDSWNAIPADVDVSFIDAVHEYENCKSDVINSLRRFPKLKYIVFDDYGVFVGVKKIVDELIHDKILQFETYIGDTDVLAANGIVRNTHEGVICSVNRH
jgi:hypothetical protein